VHVVDTNVLIYAINERDPDHASCARLLQSWIDRATPWYTTWGIVYEFLRVVTHPRVLPSPLSSVAAWQIIEQLMAEGGLRVLSATPAHARVLAEVLGTMPEARGNLMHDLETVTLMREHGLSRIVTRDADFHRFGGIEVVDPSASGR
jgi:toxin-antitoxin system PIN domain toxin